MQDPLLHNNSLPQNVTGYCPEVVPVFLEVDFYHVTMVYKGKLIFVVRVRFLMINGSKKKPDNSHSLPYKTKPCFDERNSTRKNFFLDFICIDSDKRCSCHSGRY